MEEEEYKIVDFRDNKQTQGFAFGHNKIDGCGCPSVQAGHSPSDLPAEIFVDSYDESLYHEYGHVSGVVSETIAREVWMTVLKQKRQQLQEHGTGVRVQVEFGEKVAEELGWMPDE